MFKIFKEKPSLSHIDRLIIDWYGRLDISDKELELLKRSYRYKWAEALDELYPLSNKKQEGKTKNGINT